MITFDDIKKANSSIRTTGIQGKEYAEVNQRIKAFRMVFPDGFISTEIRSLENGVCIFSATVGYYDDNNNAITLGTGTAYEKENSSFINKTSYIENCETSAVGRALGMCGFGIDASVASYEEVQNAKLNQNNSDNASKTADIALILTLNESASDEMKNYYTTFVDVYKGILPNLLAVYKLKDVNQLTAEQWTKAINAKKAWAEKHKQEVK
jgi:hypothetical protein